MLKSNLKVITGKYTALRNAFNLGRNAIVVNDRQFPDTEEQFFDLLDHEFEQNPNKWEKLIDATGNTDLVDTAFYCGMLSALNK